MTLPASIRVNVGAPFPTLILSAAFITVAKNNGIWTIGVDYTKLANLGSPVPNPANKKIAIYDLDTAQYYNVTLAQLVSIATNSYRTIIAAGDVTPLPNDSVILLNKTVGAATNIILPPSSSRNGAPITVKDYKGDANTNNITYVPNGTETIDGFSPAASAANGLALIDQNYGKKTLFPLTSGGWYL